VHRPNLSYFILGPPSIAICQYVENFSREDLLMSVIIMIIVQKQLKLFSNIFVAYRYAILV